MEHKNINVRQLLLLAIIAVNGLNKINVATIDLKTKYKY